MPELPEVENFRRLLLPLVSKSSTLSMVCPSQNPPRKFLSPDEVASLSGNCHVRSVIRKGKLICMVLDCIKKVQDQNCVYLFLHMGMTGRIAAPRYVPPLESLTKGDYPPSHTHLVFHTNKAEVSFSDPRKFGSIMLSTTQSEFQDLAPDALTMFDVEGLVGKSVGIKALLLDQKRVVSGVGNWVADELLYQSQLHPQQTYLTLSQANTLKGKLHYILNKAISCLDDRADYPESWLFHSRWSKRSATKEGKVKGPNGASVIFLKAAGRTTAIVPSIQVKRSQKASGTQKKRKNDSSLQCDCGPKKSPKTDNRNRQPQCRKSESCRRSPRLSAYNMRL